MAQGERQEARMNFQQLSTPTTDEFVFVLDDSHQFIDIHCDLYFISFLPKGLKVGPNHDFGRESWSLF